MNNTLYITEERNAAREVFYAMIDVLKDFKDTEAYFLRYAALSQKKSLVKNPICALWKWNALLKNLGTRAKETN